MFLFHKLTHVVSVICVSITFAAFASVLLPKSFVLVFLYHDHESAAAEYTMKHHSVNICCASVMFPTVMQNMSYVVSRLVMTTSHFRSWFCLSVHTLPTLHTPPRNNNRVTVIRQKWLLPPALVADCLCAVGARVRL